MKTFMNLLKKNVQLRTISYLQDVTALPFDFKTMQDLVVGNPVFIDSNVVSLITLAQTQGDSAPRHTLR